MKKKKNEEKMKMKIFDLRLLAILISEVTGTYRTKRYWLAAVETNLSFGLAERLAIKEAHRKMQQTRKFLPKSRKKENGV